MTKKKKVEKSIKPKIESNTEKLKALIVKDVIDALKPQLKEHIESLRSDLQSDFQEAIKKNSVPLPNVAPQGLSAPAAPGGGIDLKGIMDKLQNGGEVDINAIQSMIGQASAPATVGANGQPIDMANLTPGQIEYMKMTQQNSMITQFLPMILQKMGGQGNSMMNEVMQRMFYEKIFQGGQMDKMVMQHMARSMGQNLPESNFMNSFNAAATAPVPATGAIPGGLIASK